jgi:hypothetical protein
MNETYPKGSKHPSGSVGEQESTFHKGDPSATSYPGKGFKGTDFNGHKNKTLKLDQSGKFPGNPAKTSYPQGKAPSFGSEISASSLKVPAAASKPI